MIPSEFIISEETAAFWVAPVAIFGGGQGPIMSAGREQEFAAPQHIFRFGQLSDD